jgi:hypothetical protein
MSFKITQEDIRDTVKSPHKIFDCGDCGKCYYVKKIRGKGELLVMAETTEDGMNIVCFGWLQGVLYPSN